MKKQIFVDMRNARTKDQKKTMKKIVAAGIDPFAKENLKKYAKLKIIRETMFWIFAHNEWPYRGAKHKLPVKRHIMAIAKNYCETPFELRPIELTELFMVFKELSQKLKIKGGGICLRFGNTLRSGATVKRLHVHLVEPDVKKKKYEPVSFWIGGQKTEKP
jgi:hypothetical protein